MIFPGRAIHERTSEAMTMPRLVCPLCRARSFLQVFAMIVLVSVPASAIEILSGPTLIMDPNGLTPLAGSLEVSTDVASRVVLRISNGLETQIIEHPGYTTDHSVPVLGFKPNDSYQVQIAVVDQSGNRKQAPTTIPVTTAPLPADFATLTVRVSNPPLMEPGYTLLDRYARDDQTDDENYTMIVDAAGEVVWYATFGWRLFTKLADGTLMFPDLLNVMVFDMVGNELLNLPLADPGQGLHHELLPTDTGTYLCLTRKGVRVEGYPSSETDPNAPTRNVVAIDDPVLEFAADGSLLREWSLMDMLDPTRIAYGSLNQLPAGLDWAHSNAVAVDPRDDRLLVSLRHQDAVIKFDPADGSLKWIMAPHANWPPEFEPYLLDPVGTPFEWSYHMHAPEITPSGTMVLFDNGNFRASPFDGQTPMTPSESYSRAVEYLIDENTKEVSQVWEYSPQGAERLFARGRGDADMLPKTGNVLSTFAAVTYVGGVSSPDLGLGGRHARIIETDHGTPPTKVFDLQVHIPGTFALLAVYRSDRIASLYADDVGVSFFADGFESGDLAAWTAAAQ